MKYCIILVFALLSNFYANSQSKAWNDSLKINWLKQNAIKVTSVSPSDTNFSDLAPLKNVLKNAKIVMLGETHGEGNVTSAKIRLIKYLHEQMGFDMLIFESGFYDFYRINDSIKNGMRMDTALIRAVFSDMSGMNEFDPLLKYVNDCSVKGNKSFSISGFDEQNDWSFFKKDIEKNFKGIDPLSEENRKIFYTLIDKANSFKPSPFGNVNDSLQYFKDVNLYIDASKKMADKEKGSYWVQIFKSLEAYSKVAMSWEDAGNGQIPFYKVTNIRDAQMADNLIWLIDHNPNKKFIIWSASNHLSRNLKTLTETDDTAFFEHFHPMGEYIHNKYGDKAYSMGFTAAGGTRYAKGMMAEPQKITSVLNNSIECYMQRADFNYGIINYRNLSKDNFLNQENYSNPFGYNSQKLGVWPNVLDGIFFINEIVPPNFKDY